MNQKCTANGLRKCSVWPQTAIKKKLSSNSKGNFLQTVKAEISTQLLYNSGSFILLNGHGIIFPKYSLLKILSLTLSTSTKQSFSISPYN